LVKIIEIGIAMEIEIEKRHQTNMFDPDFDSDFDPEKGSSETHKAFSNDIGLWQASTQKRGCFWKRF